MLPPDRPSQPLAQLKGRSTHNRHRINVNAAREHVGGAALEQTAALEEVIAAGREQIEITDALRQVMFVTLNEVRSASLEQIQTGAPRHVNMLREIIQTSQEQLDVAALLSDTINRALESVTHIPPEEINLRVLRQVQARVRQQIEALEELIGVARQHASSAEDIAQLEQISSSLHGRLKGLERVEAVDKLTAFEQVSESAVASMMNVEHALPVDRAAALRQLIATAQVQLALLERSPTSRK